MKQVTLSDVVAAMLATIFVSLCIVAFFLDGWGVVDFRPWDAPTEEEARVEAYANTLETQIEYRQEQIDRYDELIRDIRKK